MSQQFQVYVDARGDLSIADGVVIAPGSGAVISVGDGEVKPGVSGSPAPMLDDAVEIPAIQGVILLGGSGRNVIVSGLGLMDGIYRPGRPGFWIMGAFILQVTGATTATISDPSAVVAEASTASVPAGVYEATSYGQSTYNDGEPFNLTVVTETGWPGAPSNIEVYIPEGTAVGGSYTTTDGVNYVSAADADWTLVLNADGSAEMFYNATVVALRASGPVDDPCGQYHSTPAGNYLNPEFPDLEEDAPWETNPFGTLTLAYTWSGEPDLDTTTTFLDGSVGFPGPYAAPYMTHSGDNVTTGGPETVVIDLAQAWEDGMISTIADVLGAADWYPPAGGSGPASLLVTYDLPGAPGTPVTYTLHPGSGTPASTPAIALRILADATISLHGGEWTALVTIVRRAPRAGTVYISVTEAEGDVSEVSGPYFATELPTSAGGVTHFPIATSNGTGGLKQLHAGSLVWQTPTLSPGLYAFEIVEGDLILSYTGATAPDMAINGSGDLILTL